jgi:hypothetical protein
MANGPGKYDDIATKVRKETEADGVVIVIINGKKGSGFSAQLPAHIRITLPQNLRSIADQIEEGIPRV